MTTHPAVVGLKILIVAAYGGGTVAGVDGGTAVPVATTYSVHGSEVESSTQSSSVTDGTDAVRSLDIMISLSTGGLPRNALPCAFSSASDCTKTSLACPATSWVKVSAETVVGLRSAALYASDRLTKTSTAGWASPKPVELVDVSVGVGAVDVTAVLDVGDEVLLGGGELSTLTPLPPQADRVDIATNVNVAAGMQNRRDRFDTCPPVRE
ncbi:hypothetical protein ACXR2U_01115 [Jatrophihabitans sp. YIM 134969]